jgi:hypothetical protein
MTKDEFRKILESTLKMPFYFRTDPSVCQILGKTRQSQSNDASKGTGIPCFYIGRKAAYLTTDLITYLVDQFSNEGSPSGGATK